MRGSKIERPRAMLQLLNQAICLLVLVVMSVGGTASALSGAQKSIIDANIRRFDIDEATCSTTSSSSGEVVDTAPDVLARAVDAFKYIYAHGSNSKFTPPGYTPVQVAGIVGNLMAESGVNPKASDGVAVGIAQWQGGRLPAMRAWVSSQPPPNNDPTATGGQLDYLLHELATTESGADRGLRQETDIGSATQTYMNLYERPNSNPAINHIARRKVFAQQVYDAAKAQGVFTSADDPGGDAGDINGSDSDGSTGCNTETGTGSVDCTSATGNAKILCEAQPYKGIYYRWGGGHQGIDAFLKGCPDPSKPDPNTPHGAPSDASNGGVSGNPSPCATDCSGLVSIAVDQAFNVKLGWNVSSLEGDSAHWKKINMSDAKAGDVVTKGSYHVEIVDHIVGNKAYTFGSHETGTKTGNSSSTYDGAYHYIGPGSGDGDVQN